MRRVHRVHREKRRKGERVKKQFYGRRATVSGARITNHDGIVHIVTETGSSVACGLHIATEPWRNDKTMVNGIFLPANAVVTCVPCLAWVLPARATPETW